MKPFEVCPTSGGQFKPGAIHGDLLMKLKPENGGDQLVRAGEYIVVPRGVEHCPTAVSDEVHCILFEPKTTLNTGNTCNDRTVDDLARLAE